MSVDRSGMASRAGLRPIAIVAALVLMGACTSPAASPSLSPTPTVLPAASTSPTPRTTEPPIAANPDGCPAPTEPLSPFEFSRYGGNECFPSGATLEGWWVKSDDDVVTLGQRPGSVDARIRLMEKVPISLGAGQTLPSDSGYGRFSSSSVSIEPLSIQDAVYSPLVSPAADCPTTGPIPVGVFLQTLADCFRPGVDVTVAGWRDTLDGLCGCEQFWMEKPGWLTSKLGIGWLFAEPENINLDEYMTLYAPDAAALGADSGFRPTYMEVTGHFDDPAAATCRAIADPDRAPEDTLDKEGEVRVTKELKIVCANRFVLTSLREVTPPLAALSFCPAGDPIPVASILAAPLWLPLMERLCFGGGELAITGWFDPRPQVGLESTIDPAWLDPFGRPGLWSRAEDVYVSGLWLFLFTDPAHHVELPASAGSYTMTGHFDDPAAAACVRTDGLNAGMDGDCRSEFVVTGVASGPG